VLHRTFECGYGVDLAGAQAIRDERRHDLKATA